MITWESKPFSALSIDELYELLALRARVFVVEQTCAYVDPDGKDKVAHHLLGRDGSGALVAYARLFDKGVYYTESAIGRVVTCPSIRRTGLGAVLVGEAVARTKRLFGLPIRIGAQRYLERFYARIGFEAEGEPYEEDGIPHVEMVMRAE